MNTRDIASEYRLAHWAQATRERADRGLSVRAYCAETGIHENTYFYWQRKLREAACSEIQVTGEKSIMPNGWALCVKGEPSQAQELTVEVNGYRIAVNKDTDPELLTKVCRTLKAL